MFGAGQAHAAGVWGFGKVMPRAVSNRDVIVSRMRPRPLKGYKGLFIGAIKENYRV